MNLADVARAVRGAGLPGAKVAPLDEISERIFNPPGATRRSRSAPLARPEVVAIVTIPWAGFYFVAADGRVVGTRYRRDSRSAPDWTAPRPWLVEALLGARRRLVSLYNAVGEVLGEDPLDDGFGDVRRPAGDGETDDAPAEGET